MNNFKKIGLTALASSLVATSVYAGEMSVAGSASLKLANHSGTDGGKDLSMGNQLTFTGGGEMDNGMNVSLSFILDQGDDGPATVSDATLDARGDTSPFDSHSITISSDAMGSITYAGEGGASAQHTVDTTAAGDIWNNTFGFTSGTDADSGKALVWTLPSLMDGLNVVTSYNFSAAAKEATVGYALTYTGVEGLSLTYAAGEVGGNEAGTTGSEVTTMKASFAFGPVTAAMSINEYDLNGSTSNEEQSSYKISYSVSDELSVSYGSETFETTGASTDEEFDQISVSYTTGGLTATVSQTNADNVVGAINSQTEQSLWSVGLSFAF
jgi:outer membrane protein OmpU